MYYFQAPPTIIDTSCESLILLTVIFIFLILVHIKVLSSIKSTFGTKREKAKNESIMRKISNFFDN